MIPAFAGTGLFIGTLRMQLIDKLSLHCAQTGFKADIEFHGKPLFGGDYNRVTAVIYHNGTPIHRLRGHWDSAFYLAGPAGENVLPRGCVHSRRNSSSM